MKEIVKAQKELYKSGLTMSENFRRLETVWNREGVYASGEKDEEEKTEAGKKNGK